MTSTDPATETWRAAMGALAIAAREQGVGPVQPGEDLSGEPMPAAEFDAYLAAIRSGRGPDDGLLAVASDARCLLLAQPGMPPSERAAMHEELAAADPADVPGLLRAWRVTAGLHASVGTPCALDPEPSPENQQNDERTPE